MPLQKRGLYVWRLLEIMKIFKSTQFVLIVMDLHELQTDCESMRRQHNESGVRVISASEVSNTFVQNIEKVWNEALTLCLDIELENAAITIKSVLSNLKFARNEVDYSTLSADLRSVIQAITSEFWNRKFVQVPEAYSGYVNNDELLGSEIKTAFPGASPEVREVGNCLAVECGTAAVFHLMRAVEWGLRALCKHLGLIRVRKSKKPGNVKYVPMEYAQWEKILDDAQDRIDVKINKLKAGKTKQEAQEFYYSLLHDLKGFKDAWRNHVMHTRRTYTVKDAEAIMDHVKRFMSLLATRVSE